VGGRGFTLIELTVVLLLLGVLATATVRLLIQGQRSYREQVERVQVQGNVRTGVAILVQELRELGGGSSGPDLLDILPESITYRAMRNAQFLCRAPNRGRPEIVVWSDPSYGLRQLDSDRDSILLFVENDPGLRSDNMWYSAGVGSVSRGSFCPGPAPGLRIRLTGINPMLIAGVQNGAPVRGFQVTRLLLYRDGGGQYWIGLREWRQPNGWSITQPIVGPLVENGLRLSYLNQQGETTAVPQEVALVEIKVVGVSERRWRPLAGSRGQIHDSLTTHVALRNARRNPGP
jgi:prepilin-type N-terminal cleavage/methylation domain-containing protein